MDRGYEEITKIKREKGFEYWMRRPPMPNSTERPDPKILEGTGCYYDKELGRIVHYAEIY